MDQPQRSPHGSERRQRSAQQKTRFTPEEHAQLKARADAAGMSINSYVRHQTLGKAGPRSMKKLPIDQVLIRQLIGELSRVGNNLNQIARAVNIEGDTYGIEPVIGRLEELFETCFEAMGKKL